MLPDSPQSRTGIRAGAPVTASKRSHERQELITSAVMYEFDDHGDIGAGFARETIDISRSGMGIRSRRMAHAGRCVIIRVKLATEEQRVFFGRVRYSRYDARGQYHIGIRFENRPTGSTVRRWLRQEGLA